MGFATLRVLHACIGNAINNLERAYRKRSQSDSPLDFPDLDDPYYASADSHSEAEQLIQELYDDPSVSMASMQIVAACGQLCATVNRPWHGVIETIEGGQLPQALRFLEAAHIPEILRDAGSEGLHVKDIQRSVADLRPKDVAPDPTILTPERLGHILRLLATSHWIREVSPNVFANNRRSSLVDSGKSLVQLRDEPENKHLGSNGISAFIGLMGDECFKFTSYMTEWLLPDTRIGSLIVDAKGGFHRTQHTGTDVAAPTPYASPFNLAFDTKLNFFPWLELPENRARLHRFGRAMAGTRQWETTENILHSFPWADLAPGSLLVDVGGGLGITSSVVARAHNHIKVVVEDRPQVVEAALLTWGRTKYAPLLESGRMTFRAKDIFAQWEPLMSGKEPDVFLLRLVLHDWPDEESRSILRRLRSAAGPSTKLLIGDLLLPYACRIEGAFAPEDSPLLPNLGMANLHGYLIDIMIMNFGAAKERTVDEMSELALSSGWKITDIRRSPGSLWAYTTAVPCRDDVLGDLFGSGRRQLHRVCVHTMDPACHGHLYVRNYS
ncbi:S-adenosyl-L-methionine-dependent methyltransferase [Trametes maxima]|nr:S-adenosyl-L-methionine-dependent methyltransferase [Trametes maxima]